MGRRLDHCLAEGRPAFGIWVTLRSPDLTELIAISGLDWMVLDLEHTDLAYADLSNHLRAAQRSDITVIVRIAHLYREIVQRSLDLGADGVMIPMAHDTDSAKQALAYARYPPEGARGISPARANDWGGYTGLRDRLAETNARVFVIPMIESREAAASVEEIFAVPGLRAAFVGPADLSASFGDVGGFGDDPAVARAIERILTAASAADLPLGIMATSPEDAAQKIQRGYRLIGVGSDIGMFSNRLSETVAAMTNATPR